MAKKNKKKKIKKRKTKVKKKPLKIKKKNKIKKKPSKIRKKKNLKKKKKSSKSSLKTKKKLKKNKLKKQKKFKKIFKLKKKKLKKKKPKKKKIKTIQKPSFFEKLKEKVYEYFRRLKIKFLIYLEKLKIKQTKRDIQNLERLLKQEQKFAEKKERDREKFRLQLIKDIKLEERKKIYQLKDHLWKVGDRFAVIRQRYQEYRQKIREKQLEELEVRRKSREEARAILEAEKAENALKQKLVERLERFSRNMKSIVFQINKRYITKKRSPLRFIDNISESGECLIRNDDAPTDKDYLILLYVEGEDVTQRLKNPICLDDKTDIGNAKNFQPKDIFEASDYIIDRLAIMFDKERKLKK
ncbi:MAG: hypothetical protein VW560_02490 [Pelagibacteraceae bacterium]